MKLQGSKTQTFEMARAKRFIRYNPIFEMHKKLYPGLRTIADVDVFHE
jgi:hypothetical protein